MHIFGLTGGIASGKSSVSSLLEESGLPIIDADVIAREGTQSSYLVGVVCFGVSDTFYDLWLDKIKTIIHGSICLTHISAAIVVKPGKPALKLIVKHFGADILQRDGKLDRKKLSRVVFEDESKRRVLNQCTHPYIQKSMMWQIVKYFLKGHNIYMSP